MAGAPDPFQALRYLEGGLAALRAHEDDVNKLNVFPVPDGDTGTNMVLTMQAVLAECAKAPAGDMNALARAATDGSLMGARGNSGVILSQIIRGLVDELGQADRLDVETVAAALARAREVALKAIRKPVAGTMLTVIEDAAAAASELAAGAGAADAWAQAPDLGEFMESVLRAIWRSVECTPELLPVLKEAGVVDAGGFGLAVLAEGILRSMQGRAPEEHAELVATPRQLSQATEAEVLEYGYCTELLVRGELPTADEVRSWLEGVGGSIMVAGEPGLLKVHVHTNDPGRVLSHLAPYGRLFEIHITNMEEQTSERRAGIDAELAARTAATLHAEAPARPRKRVGVAAVVAGEGLAAIMRSLGADAIIEGGQSMNPSIGEIAQGVEAAGAEHVLVLPNNKNVLAAARQLAASFAEQAQAKEEAEGGGRCRGAEAPPVVHVVPTRTIPEGLAALIVYDPDGEPEEVAREMEAEIERVVSGAVTTAVRDSRTKNRTIRAGDVIGLADHDIRIVGRSIEDVAVDLAAFLASETKEAETITILAGEDLDDAGAERIASGVRERVPELEVEWRRGGQPLYPVILGLE